jgi:hypothetical protein
MRPVSAVLAVAGGLALAVARCGTTLRAEIPQTGREHTDG